MIHIPKNKYEQYLTDWVSAQIHCGQLTDDEIRTYGLLLRISKSQMVRRNRGDEYPYIEDFRLTPEEYDIIVRNRWEESENIEVRAYCLDLCSGQKKDKRAIKRVASIPKSSKSIL